MTTDKGSGANHDLEHSPVFLLGMHRSGTTLMQCMLDGHPEAVVDVGDSGFFTPMLAKALPASFDERVRITEDTLLRHYHKTDSNNYRYVSYMPWEEVQTAFRRRLENTPKRMPDFLSSAVLAAGEVSNQINPKARYWIEKTPCHEMFAEQIFTWWPNARCIHVTRDPRGTFGALHKRNPKQNSVDAVAYLWGRSAGCMESNQARYGADLYLGVRYEDIVTDPKGQVARVCEFLGIEDLPILYRPTKSGAKHDWGGNSAYGQKFAGIDPTSIEKWRGSVSNEHIAMLEALLGDQMQRLNYELAMPSSFATKMRVFPLRAKIAFRIARQKKRNEKELQGWQKETPPENQSASKVH